MESELLPGQVALREPGDDRRVRIDDVRDLRRPYPGQDLESFPTVEAVLGLEPAVKFIESRKAAK